MKTLLDQRLFLGSLPLFANVADKDLQEVLAITRSRHFKKHHRIVKQGDKGNSMYLITKGSVEVKIQLDEDEYISAGILLEGNTFGEIALFDQHQRTASIIALEDCECLQITRDAFTQFLLQHPAVSLQLLKTMALRLRATSEAVTDMVSDNVSSRIANTLSKIAQAYGQNTRQGLRIDMEFNPRELGEFAGVPGDVVAAQLKHWEKTGLISMHHGQLVLLRPEELDRIQH